MQQKVGQGRASASRHPQPTQATPHRSTYLDELLYRAPGRESAAGMAITVEDEHDKADREARARYQKRKKHYEEIRKRNGKLGFAEDIQWMKIRGAEETRLRKRKRDQDMARQAKGELDLLPERSGDHGQHDDMIEDDDPAGSSRISPSSSKRVFPSMMEAELQSMQVALQANGDRPSKKKKGARMPQEETETAQGRGRGKGSNSKAYNAASRTAKKGRRQTAADRKAVQGATRLHNSLMYSDVFRQQANENAPEQPTFSSTKKADALKELIASVPTEHQKSAKDDTQALLRATKDFDGHGSCKADGNGMWKVKGMATSLKHFQVMGTAFMRRRENDLHEPRGGLMADQMGLGKTLMMLANIVNGRGNSDEDCKTTLLVAGPALLTQWASEIDLHTDGSLSVMRHTSGNRISSSHPYEVFARHDIILTTYHEVLRSYPKNEPPIECQSAEQKIAWWKQVYEKNRGSLHRMMFHRVVLDEAQAIKNHQSRTSLACRALMARHKWALSGTPILNSLDELYSYFKFLGVPYTGSFKLFKRNYADPKEPESIERLLIRLSQFMIRRDHSNIMMNAPILKLPRASQMTHWCEFNSVERGIYEIVRQRFAKRINLASRENELEKSYNNALVMLLRLRQLTAHILMLQSVVQDLLEQEDIEKIREIVQMEATSQGTRKARTILAIRKQLDHLEAEAKKQSANKATNRSKKSHRLTGRNDDDDSGERDIEEMLDDSQEIVDDNQAAAGRPASSGRSFGKNFDFRPYLNSLTTGENWDKVKKKAMCADCAGRLRGAWLTSCGHMLCTDCYDAAQLEAAEEDHEKAKCKGCGSIFTHANEIQENGDEFVSAGPATRAKRQQHSKEVLRIEQQDIAEDWLTWGGEGVLPSAKTIALKAQLLNWFNENPNVKVIIYTQFLAMIRIIRKMCTEEHWGTEEYHGKMSHEARDKAIQHFANDAGVQVLLASLRCGGLGLNLTMASRVVILDPWWNSASEQQAFCRVFRFGQTETTCLTRFCVKNTVDERLIQMQERKEKEIDSVMKDDAGAKARKMGIRDLMRLFGSVGDDEEGRPFILADNGDARGGFVADDDHEGYADEL
ncbi:SNF2 family domain-containing protein [Paraphaeosphaeria sporulosa]